MSDAAENPRAVAGDNSVTVAGDQLKSFVERIERLEEEKAGIAGDIKGVFAEMKGDGFDPKIVRDILKIRKQDENERAEHAALLNVYCRAVGLTVFD